MGRSLHETNGVDLIGIRFAIGWLNSCDHTSGADFTFASLRVPIVTSPAGAGRPQYDDDAMSIVAFGAQTRKHAQVIQSQVSVGGYCWGVNDRCLRRYQIMYIDRVVSREKSSVMVVRAPRAKTSQFHREVSVGSEIKAYFFSRDER